MTVKIKRNDIQQAEQVGSIDANIQSSDIAVPIDLQYHNLENALPTKSVENVKVLKQQPFTNVSVAEGETFTFLNTKQTGTDNELIDILKDYKEICINTFSASLNRPNLLELYRVNIYDGDSFRGRLQTGTHETAEGNKAFEQAGIKYVGWRDDTDAGGTTGFFPIISKNIEIIFINPDGSGVDPMEFNYIITVRR